MAIKIRITGSGTKDDVADALINLGESLKSYPDEASVDGAEWEDEQLMTEISLEEDEQ